MTKNYSGSVEFGSKDSKGRSLGVVWDMTWTEEGQEGRTNKGPGYYVTVAAARNGEAFGGGWLPPLKPLPSLDAAFAEICRRASATFKRYKKNHP